MLVTNFRNLNNNERRSVKKTCNRNNINLNVNKLEIAYSTLDNFTMCEIKDKETQTVRLGVAKRNPVDKPNPEKGKALALRRAIKG